MTVPQITDRLPILLRAYAVPISQQSNGKNKGKSQDTKLVASYWTLVFDCETKTDSAQSLRFGTYQVREAGALNEAGIFYSNSTLDQSEIAALRNYAARNRLECISHAEFIEHIFYRVGFNYRASIVGFNLPFDISRIAIGHNSARGKMRGGFTFNLSDNKQWPNIQIKHLSAKAAFIQFAAPQKNRSSRSQVKRDVTHGIRRGHFIDCKTLSHALLAKSFSLSTLCDELDIENQKLEFEDFDGPITDEFIDYAVRDTQATWECYQRLIDKFEKLGFHDARPEKIYSEASLGKACLRTMGIKSWQECQPDFDPQIIGNIMSAYYGGRSEIRIRRTQRQVMLCDFLSMYPTVCTLMELWRYVISTGMKTYDATAKAQSMLDSITLAKLQRKLIWKKLTVLVRVKPNADIFPVRACYGDAAQATIGLNYLTNDSPQWFTLADCIASKLLTGKTPEIVEAIGFSPKRKQNGLESYAINGDTDYEIEPAKDDLFKRFIELRQSTKRKQKLASGSESDKLNTQQNALKIMANSTSYGIFVEMIVEDAKAKAQSQIYNGSDNPFIISPSENEKAGNFFHPLLATLITGAARLMLAITETLASDKGLDWTFCDTDSMALAKPDNMGGDVFTGKVQEIIDWFNKLNPYDFEGSILKSEDVNYSLSCDGKFEPLYCFAVSAKRYALYNLDVDGKPIIRKASAHGLGHLRPPYNESNRARGMAKPQIDLTKSEISLWQHDLWVKTIEAGNSDNPYQIDLSYHPALQLPAISRYAATSPHLLRWFKQHNDDLPYVDEVKPFGFLTALSANDFDISASVADIKTGRRKKKSAVKPISPFETDPAKAALRAFDRNTGKYVSPDMLKSYAQSIAQYHLQPENKFLNSDYRDSGLTVRRHVKATVAAHIGKEANEWERQAMLGYDSAAQPVYGYGANDIVKIQIELERLCGVFSKHEMAQYEGVTAGHIAKFMASNCKYDFAVRNEGKMEYLTRVFRKKVFQNDVKNSELILAIAKYGLRETARRRGVDPSNLWRAVKFKKKKTIYPP